MLGGFLCLAAAVGYIGATGGTLTIVSPMVPMTILVIGDCDLGEHPLALRGAASRPVGRRVRISGGR